MCENQWNFYLGRSDDRLYVGANVAFLTSPNYRSDGKKYRMDIILTRIFMYYDFDSILILCKI